MSNKIEIPAYPEEMVADAKRLYLKYKGKKQALIEKEMRERGWHTFYRELLYPRRRAGGIREGWPELYGWKIRSGNGTPKEVSTVGTREFQSWLEKAFPDWQWSWRYQRYLYERLNAVTTGKCKRLMIFMPPRHGKSETVTVRYTAWRLLRDPKLNVILGSYNQRLADRFSRKIRRIVELRSAECGVRNEKGTSVGSVFSSVNSVVDGGERPETTEHTESTERTIPQLRRLQSVAEWETTGGGAVRSVGVGGGIAGFGAGLIVIDDPVRNRADAESETYREKVWDWFNDDIYTRLEPDAAIILIQTRWHEDDLAGRLLREQEEGGEKWEVVKLPAIAEDEVRNADCGVRNEKDTSVRSVSCSVNSVVDGRERPHTTEHTESTEPIIPQSRDPLGRKPGQALCPKRFNVSALERIRKKIGSYSFSALYQQDPVPAQGGRFKREWFRNIVDQAPANLRWKRGYDLAISTRTSADYTASFRCAFDREGNLYIADGFRKRMEFPDQRRYITERMQSEPGTEHGIESALHGKAVVQELRREPALRRYAFREVRVDEDKLTRALSWLNLAEAGKVFLVRGPWIDEFVDEVCRFPSGRHDDQVDAVSIAVSMATIPRRNAWGF